MPKGRRSVGSDQDVVNNLCAALNSLLAQRSQLDQRIAAIQGGLSVFGVPAGSAARGGRVAATKRIGGGAQGFRKGSLKEHIFRALSSGGQMRVKDVAQAVKKGGFKTKNKTLDKSVGIALGDMPMVDRVGRGIFKLK